MLDTVWVVQLFAMAIVVPLIFGVIGFLHRFYRSLWPFVLLCFLYVASSMLAWQAVIEIRWIAHAAIALMLICAAIGLPHFIRASGDFWSRTLAPELLTLKRFPRVTFFLLSAALLLELSFAAFPGYRYDQYNYHLITPKLVTLYGKLPPYVGTDHTHFTGSWEYFFTSFRSLITNDLLIQTITTTFTFLAYVIPASALLWLLARPRRWLPLWFVGLPALVIYAHTELEPVISAKPDFVLVATALAIVAAQKLPQRQRFFFSFFFLSAGVSFKVTWFHAAAALGCGVIASLWYERNSLRLNQPWKQSVITALAALTFGALCVVPVFYKNILFFGNPIHPTQAGPLKSFVATDSFLQYWETVTGRPQGLFDTLTNIGRVLPQSIMLMKPLGILLLCCLYFPVKKILRHRYPLKGKLDKFIRSSTPWIAAWLMYLVIWGILFRFDIYNRFIAVGSIFPLLLITRLARCLPSASVFAACLLTPFVINAAAEVKIRRIWKGAMQTYSEYSNDNFAPSVQDFREARIIEEHASKKFGETWRETCNIFSNKPNHYFYNTRFIAFDDQNFEYHIRAFGREKFELCPWAYFKEGKFCYLIATHEYEFSRWPEPLQSLVKAADENIARGENADLRLLFISPSTLEQIIQANPNCMTSSARDSQQPAMEAQ